MADLHFRTCNLCEAMCGLAITHENGRVVSIRGDADDPLSRGHMCTKALALREVYEDPDRLRRPLRRRGADWEEIAWEEALEETASRLLETRRRHGRHSVAAYVGNPTVHDLGAMIFGTLFDGALRTGNHYTATSVDQLPRMFVSRLLYGHQGLFPIPDLDRTEFLLIVGANPLASNGSILTAPGIGRRLKALRERGGKVVLFDPRRTETAGYADEHHFIRPGTDALLLLAMLEAVFAAGTEEPGRLAAFTDGLEDLRDLAARFPAERVEDATGVPAAITRRLAAEIATAPSAALYGRVGACTQRFGGLVSWLLDALAVVTGNLDRPGGLMFPRPAVDLVGLGARFGTGRGSIARRRSRVRGLPSFGGAFPAIALAEEILTPGDGRIRALVTQAGNPVLSLPNGRHLEEALPKLDFMVSIDIYLNETTRHAHLILPPAHALEQDHYDLAFHLLAVRNTAKFSPALFEPASGNRQSWRIYADLAERLEIPAGGPAAPTKRLKWRLLNWLGPRGLLDLALRLGPWGDRFRPFSGGLSLARLKRHPHGIDLGPLEPRLPDVLATRERRIDLAPEMLVGDVSRLEATLDERPPALALIGRRHVKDNNSWMHNVPRLMAGKNRCTLRMHPTDAAARGLEDGATVKVRSRVGEVEVPLEVSDEVMPGVVSLPHGYGHGRPGVRLRVASRHPGVSLNDLTDETFFDELTGNAALNGTPVEVEAGTNGSREEL